MPGPLDGILAGNNGAVGAPEPDDPDDVAVTVQQLTCREPGCPPVETVIAVLAVPPRRWNIHLPVTAISDEMLARLLADNPDGDSHDDG